MRSLSGYTDHPFTVAACTVCTPEVSARVLPPLRAVVRNCPHAVLILTAGLPGKLHSVSHIGRQGVILLLQPCTVDRVPVMSARWIGPVRTAAEAQMIGGWIAAGDWDPGRLPPGLRVEENLARSAALN